MDACLTGGTDGSGAVEPLLHEISSGDCIGESINAILGFFHISGTDTEYSSTKAYLRAEDFHTLTGIPFSRYDRSGNCWNGTVRMDRLNGEHLTKRFVSDGSVVCPGRTDRGPLWAGKHIVIVFFGTDFEPFDSGAQCEMYSTLAYESVGSLVFGIAVRSFAACTFETHTAADLFVRTAGASESSSPIKGHLYVIYSEKKSESIIYRV